MSPPVVAAMRRYVFGFVNSHDFAVCRELMSENYLLHMGDSEVRGRETSYIPAVLHQIDQFPDMSMTVHDLITNGTHAVLYFSEHGRTRDGLVAAWQGVSIYRFDGRRLVECWVEQDHFSRRRQLEESQPLALPSAAAAPFSRHPAQDIVTAELLARKWLGGLTCWPPAEVHPDAGPYSCPWVELDQVEVVANVVVAADDRVGFHITVWGDYRGSLPGVEALGQRMPLHVCAIATVRGERIDIEYVATNRIALLRKLRSSAESPD